MRANFPRLDSRCLLIMTAAVLLGCCAAPQRLSNGQVFDAGRALNHIKALVDLGPRPPGSSAIVNAQDYIKRNLQQQKIPFEEQAFMASTPHGSIPMKNLVAKIEGARPEIIVISGHYDTKLFTDIRFIGANDGGSSAAFLIEFARAMKSKKNTFTYWVVFFDGEEAIGEWSETDSLYGSRYFVNELRRSGKLKGVKAAINVDMIGDRNLQLLREGNSTEWLTDEIWKSAATLGLQKHFLRRTFYIGGDDHFPFLRAGIPAVDLIDFDYGFNNLYWHSEQDTLDKVSAESLDIVARVLLHALPQIEARLSSSTRTSRPSIGVQAFGFVSASASPAALVSAKAPSF